MSPSLREERKVRTRAAIVATALHLFALHGYGAVTVSEIAAAAGVGERTLYRYFADKEELLFAEDVDMRETLRAGIEAQPAGRAPVAVLRAASATVARILQGRREEMRARAEVVSGAPALAAREQAKHAAWAALLAHELTRRGVDAGQATLLGRVAVSCYDEAVARWLTPQGAHGTLEDELEATFTQLAALVGAGP